VSVNLGQRLDLADGVLHAAAGLPPGVLGIIGIALQLDGGQLAQVGGAFDSAEGGSGELARLQLARALDRLARFGDPALLGRLTVEAEPWRALGLAVAELRDEGN
jgi:hypothetical protein